MTDTTNTPEPDGQGTFVGGTFGRRDGATDPQAAPDLPTSAEELEPSQQEQQEEDLLVAAPAGSGASTDEAFPSDVEGTSAEPTPGERNEPV